MLGSGFLLGSTQIGHRVLTADTAVSAALAMAARNQASFAYRHVEKSVLVAAGPIVGIRMATLSTTWHGTDLTLVARVRGSGPIGAT